jgi:NADPH:quinone reductase-like Zn-dependent oxidoreductase
MSDIAAIRFAAYGPPDKLAIHRVPAPRSSPGEVLIEVHAASVNPVDWKVRSGRLSRAFPVDLPMTTGRDGSGIVLSAEGVEKLVGKRVCFLAPRGVGTWAERIVLPAALAVPTPPALSFAQSAALPLAGLSAWAALVKTARVGAGMKILIHAAAGGVGTMAVQIAKDFGAYVTATCSQRNADFVRALGAQEVIPYDQAAFEDQLRDIDVVLDPMGGDVHRRSYNVLRKGGMMVCLAAEPFEDRSAAYGVTVRMAQVAPDADALATLVGMAEASRVRPIVERTLPFSDFVRAHAYSESGHARGKTVLMIR